MNSRNRLSIILILLILSPIITTSCARQTAAGDADIETYEPPPPIVRRDTVATQATETRAYDLEQEMPEQDDVDPEDLEESIAPLPTDTVGVEEVSIPAKPEESFGMGYRIQVFASNELESAERMKQKVAGEIAFPVYIEYEGGYYKVRVGDFTTRDEAAAARAGISELYSDCWIVNTTIRK